MLRIIAEINKFCHWHLFDFSLTLKWIMEIPTTWMDEREGFRRRSFKLTKFAQAEINIPFHVIEQFEYQKAKEFSAQLFLCWIIEQDKRLAE